MTIVLPRTSHTPNVTVTSTCATSAGGGDHLHEARVAPDADALIRRVILFMIVLCQHPPLAEVRQVLPLVVPQHDDVPW